MAAGIFDLDIEQGSDCTWVLTLTSKPPDPQPIVLTGYTARAQIRPSRGRDTAVLHELTTANGRLVIDGPAGTITIHIPGDESTPWVWTEGVYDLELVSPSGAPTRLLMGAVRVDPEVTR
ncbi:hypothetical protein ABT352_32905 [Streptosporangium sp. NPDC000563]|uniref:hypothetical protein n=1 Tax=Streptosporangium sp. NPDC000563 TaxID=3154366 RepID=UPI00332A0439